MERIDKGDSVVAKGGGPVMTVLFFLKRGDPQSAPWLRQGWREGDVLCQWRDEKTGTVERHPFELAWLTRVADQNKTEG